MATDLGTDMSLGHKLRQRRKQIGKTMQSVADEAGLSVGFISQVERDLSSPSLSSLINIAGALDSGVENFIRSPVRPGTVSRRNERTTYTTGSTAPVYERLSDAFDGSVLNSTLMHLPPHYRAEENIHDGEEMMFVVSGRVLCTVDAQTRLLEEGDSVHFPSHLPHRTENPDETTAIVLWVGTLRLFDNDVLISPSLGNVPAQHADPAHHTPRQGTGRVSSGHTNKGEQT
ncbi:MAG: cupin domain-containing protein [Pseudomonadota bacterium]